MNFLFIFYNSRVIIADTIAKARIIWEDEEIEEEDETDTLFPEDSPQETAYMHHGFSCEIVYKIPLEFSFLKS